MTTPDLSDDIRRQISLDPPRFRGVMHAWCTPIAVIAGVVAVLHASGVAERLMIAVYSFTVVVMFGVSAAFHRGKWDDTMWWRMRQLDHTGIYLIIAGSFTGIAGPSMTGTPRVVLLAVVWVVAGLGIAYRWAPVVPPFGLTTLLYILLAGIVVPFIPDLLDGIGGRGLFWLMLGCGVYFVGAMGLGVRRPDPWPETFGYHEVWHVLVTVAAGMHWWVSYAHAVPAR